MVLIICFFKDYYFLQSRVEEMYFATGVFPGKAGGFPPVLGRLEKSSIGKSDQKESNPGCQFGNQIFMMSENLKGYR